MTLRPARRRISTGPNPAMTMRRMIMGRAMPTITACRKGRMASGDC